MRVWMQRKLVPTLAKAPVAQLPRRAGGRELGPWELSCQSSCRPWGSGPG